MKRILPIFLLLVTFFVACNPSVKTEQISETTNQAKVKSVSTPTDPLVIKMQELGALQPLGLDELAALLPQSLQGIKRSGLSMSNNMGYATAHADYEKNNKTDMRVTLYDCSGTAGLAWFRTSYASRLKNASTNENGYTKTIDLNGAKAIEDYDNKSKVTSITYLSRGRILVNISSRNMDPEVVKEAAGQIGH
ncbi:MAG TPA: hypothetical protein VJ499_10200 [Flavisolibacter sp.]|nr:hypothetical protein [Flavisolibacter sp.]